MSNWRAQASYPALFLIAALCLLYSSPLYTTYYAWDEASYLFPESDYPLTHVLRDVLLRGWHAGLWNGRPFASLCWTLFRSIASTFENGLLWIRVLQLAASCATALLLCDFLRRRGVTAWWAACAVLFLWSQPPFHIYHVVTMAMPYWPAIAAALISVDIVFPSSPDSSPRTLARQLRAAAGLLVVGWLTYQAAPFCALAALTFCALQATPAQWQRQRARYAAYLGVFLALLLIYPLTYKAYRALVPGAPLYALVGRAFALLSGNVGVDTSLLHPASYLGLFEWWNYLYPIELPQTTYLYATGASALVWLAVCAAALGVEAHRHGRRYAMERAGLLLLSFGLTLLPMIAATFERNHGYIASVLLVGLALVHCVAVVLRRLSPNGLLQRGLTVPAMALLIVVSLGARASFERALVRPNERYYNFVVNEFRRQASKPHDRIVVVNTPQTCRWEPCRGMHGYRMSLANRVSDRAFYQTIVRWNGGPAGLPVEFVSSTEDLDTSQALLIDNRILFAIVANEVR